MSNGSIESALVRLRIGHVGLNQHLLRVNMSDTPLCDSGELENREYFLIYCPLYTQQRYSLLAELRKLTIHLSLTVKLLLGGETL